VGGITEDVRGSGRRFIIWPNPGTLDSMRRIHFIPTIHQRLIASFGRVLKTAIASGLAWQIALLTGTTRPYFAPLAAILCMQVTVEESLMRGYQRVIGIVGGIIVADLSTRFFGIHAWSIALIVFIGTCTASLLKLGQQAVPQVGVSAMMVLTVGMDQGRQSYALDRIAETIIGVVIAVLVNMFLWPPDYSEQAKRYLLDAVEQLAERFEAMADWLRRGADVTEGEELRHPTVGYLQYVHETVNNVEQAMKALRFNPLVRRKEEQLRRLEAQLIRIRQGYAHATGMMRTLLEWRRDGDMSQSDMECWSERLQEVARFIRAWRKRWEEISNGSVSVHPTHPEARLSFAKDIRESWYDAALFNDTRQLFSDFSIPEPETGAIPSH
jgi:uncharacterized membrane protein YgaE (UPF0421/DUF939 family)